jgi:hypothetical protein
MESLYGSLSRQTWHCGTLLYIYNLVKALIDNLIQYRLTLVTVIQTTKKLLITELDRLLWSVLQYSIRFSGLTIDDDNNRKVKLVLSCHPCL